MSMKKENIKAAITGGISALLVLAGGLGLEIRSELFKPIEGIAGLFRIHKDDTLRDVAFALRQEGIIDNPILLIWYGEITGRDRYVREGVYRIPPSLRMKQLLELFEKGSNVRFKVVLLEGLTLKQSVKKMREAGLEVDEEFFFHPPSKFTDQYGFLEYLPQGQSLEGFLFPDSYQFYPNETNEGIARVLLDTFDAKFKPEWYDVLASQGRSVYETVTMASLLEKEVPTLKEKKIVSGILWKRLALGMPLQVDATVNYTTGKSLSAVTLEDIAVDSPYNTYKNQGLPLGPIANPGQESLEAAVLPEPSDYWFYLSRQDTGETIFSKTFNEHRIAKARYLR